MQHMREFVAAAGFNSKDLRKGQVMQFMNALWRLSRPDENNGAVTLDAIVDYIIDHNMWFNPNKDLTGFKGSNRSCDPKQDYKSGGVSVMDMVDGEKKRQAIMKILKLNVLNKMNYQSKHMYYTRVDKKDKKGRLVKAGTKQEGGTRVSDNSVFVKGWCEEVDGGFKFTRSMQDKLNQTFGRNYRVPVVALTVGMGIVAAAAAVAAAVAASGTAVVTDNNTCSVQ